jgi:outer membrane murein-binding lipoprotein Lpp
MKSGDFFRGMLLSGTIVGCCLLAGCGAEVKVPERDAATVEQNRQKYEEMAKQERGKK